MATYTIKVETGHYHMSPFAFISYAEDFYEACISHTTKRPFSPTSYYLASHSIELSLKAFLLLQGISRDALRKKSLGHDLHKILKKCKELGISQYFNITDKHSHNIEKLNKWYWRKGFEYFEIQNLVDSHKELPDLVDAQTLASELITSLKRPCLNEANKP